MQSRNYFNNSIYSTLVKLNIIWVYSLDTYIIGQTVYIISYPVRYFVVLASLRAIGFCQLFNKLASTETSNILFFLGSKMCLLFLFPGRYQTKLSTAAPWGALESSDSFARWWVVCEISGIVLFPSKLRLPITPWWWKILFNDRVVY